MVEERAYNILSDFVVGALEEIDEERINLLDFGSYASIEEIQEKLETYIKSFNAGKLNISEDIMEELKDQLKMLIEDKKSLTIMLDTLRDEKRVLTLVNKRDEFLGYRSRNGEIVRQMHNLHFFSERDITPRLDVGHLKYVRNYKIVAPREHKTLTLIDELSKIISKYIITRSLAKEVASIFLKAIAKVYPSLNDIQYESLLSMSKQLEQRRPEHFVFTASTGGGKTLAFLLVPMLYCFLKKIQASNARERTGIKVIIIYPRNALAGDQAEVIDRLVSCLNEEIDSMDLSGTILDSMGRDYLKITYETDYGGMVHRERRRIYLKNPPDIIITNSESIKNRMAEPYFYENLKNLGFLILDEVHLYNKLLGTNIALLIRRFRRALRWKYGKTRLVLIGASATISSPQEFCKSLFSLREDEKIELIAEKPLGFIGGIEHHVFIQPAVDRSPLSVALDATSLLMHSRRNGLAQAKVTDSVANFHKSIFFADSLDTIGNFARELTDWEQSWLLSRTEMESRRQLYRQQRHLAGYMRYAMACRTCSPINQNIDCPLYNQGLCWPLSQQDFDQRLIARRSGTHPFTRTRMLQRRDLVEKFVNPSSIITRQYTSKVGEGTGEDIFKFMRRTAEDERNQIPPRYYDLVAASPSLEVGVDIRELREIILFKAYKSATTYKQKVGRGARDVDKGFTNDIFALSIMTNNPIDQYFFHNYHTLINPSYETIPIKTENKAVLRMHVFCAIFDFMALNGIDVYRLTPVKQFGEDADTIENNIEKAFDILNTREHDLEKYLAGITKDEDIVSKALSVFKELLLRMLDSNWKRILNVPTDDNLIGAIVKSWRDIDYRHTLRTSLDQNRSENTVLKAKENMEQAKKLASEAIQQKIEVDFMREILESLENLSEVI